MVIKSLLEKGILSSSRDTVMIEREVREPIYPCGRSYGLGRLDLSQLEWAIREGQFWFLGPIIALKKIIETNSIGGVLRLVPNRMIFTTTLNILNYDNFETVAYGLSKMAQQLGLELTFQQLTGSYNVNLTISSEKLISVDNISEFIDKIFRLHQSSDGL